MENRLTQGQIEAACAEIDIDQLPENIVTAIAPHVQYPIAPPTDDEIEEALRRWHVAQGADTLRMRLVLSMLVSDRNSPPDPLREKIRAVLNEKMWMRNQKEEVIDRIIEAVKESGK